MFRRFLFIGITLAFVVAGVQNSRSISADFECAPTAADSEGPFYEPDAPVRSSVGLGYILTGTVQSTKDCAPIPNVQIEFWLANPAGMYDDEHRATVFANQSGSYRFESNFPPRYNFRPPHIHMRITADGFKPLVTQHYPKSDTTTASFDLVLIPLTEQVGP